MRSVDMNSPEPFREAGTELSDLDEDSPRDTLPCPPPSSISPHSFDLTVDYWDDENV